MNRRLIVLLLLLLPGCVLPTSTPAALPPPSPTLVPTSLPTSVPTEEAVPTSTEAADYRLHLIRHEHPPSGQVEPEWSFVDLATGEEVSGHLTLYAAPALVYSGYPLVEVEGTRVTFAGVPGTHTPVIVIGASEVLDTAGNPVDTEVCGAALCFQAEGGQTYRFGSGRR